MYDFDIILVQRLLWAGLLRALLLLRFPQAGFFGVGSSRFRRVGFLAAVHGLGHRLSPATTAALYHPHPPAHRRVLPPCGCCFLQKNKTKPLSKYVWLRVTYKYYFSKEKPLENLLHWTSFTHITFGHLLQGRGLLVYSHFEAAGSAEEADDGGAAAGSWQSPWNLWTQRRTACSRRPASEPAAWPGPFSPPGSEDEVPRSGPPGSRGSAGPEGRGQERDTDGHHCEFSDCDVFSHADLEMTSNVSVLPTWTALGLFLGSHCSRSFIRMMASLLAFGMRVFRGVGTHWGKRKFMAEASWWPSGQSVYQKGQSHGL